nr:hypothetical protein Iba_chr10bCG4530 [Ipomoea batatas]
MPPISSQVLADTPTNLRAAINLTSSVNTKVQASRGRSSQSFQVNTTNCHAIGQLLSQNLTTETRDATNRMMSNATIHPARNLEEEFSATLQDTSKVMQASLGQASRGRSSKSFQVNTTNTHAIGQLLSQNLTTETRDAKNRMMSNPTIYPARNLEEEFSATLQDTSKVMQASLDVDNVQSVAPPINTNVQTSSGLDINNTIVIPPAPDGT